MSNSEENQTSIQQLNFMSICDMAESNTNKISIDKYHIDIMGDLAGAAFLTQLRYWFSPTTKSAVKGQTRVGIRREGKLWLAKKDVDWWDECYVTPKQVKRIKKKLIDLDIVKIKLFKFDGAPMVHYHLDLEKYTRLYHKQRLMNVEKESYELKEREKKAMNKRSQRDLSQRDKSIRPKGPNGFGPKGQNYNISSKHLLSSFDLKEHMENVFKKINEIDMFSLLTGKPLQQYKSFGNDRKASVMALMTLPKATDNDESFNAVQAVKIASSHTPDEVNEALIVLAEHIEEGTVIKKTGSYITWILKKELKPKSPNIKLNKHFWGSIKNSVRHLSIKEHSDVLEFDDYTAFYFWMDHEHFKKKLTDEIHRRGATKESQSKIFEELLAGI